MCAYTAENLITNIVFYIVVHKYVSTLVSKRLSQYTGAQKVELHSQVPRSVRVVVHRRVEGVVAGGGASLEGHAGDSPCAEYVSIQSLTTKNTLPLSAQK